MVDDAHLLSVWRGRHVGMGGRGHAPNIGGRAGAGVRRTQKQGRRSAHAWGDYSVSSICMVSGCFSTNLMSTAA